MPVKHTDPAVNQFLAGKSAHTIGLYKHFLEEFSDLGNISLHATKTMIAVSNQHKRVAWVTQLGKNFIHVVLPLKQPYLDNMCFTKVGQVPGATQFNHHLRILQPEDINDEVRSFFRIAIEMT